MVLEYEYGNVLWYFNPTTWLVRLSKWMPRYVSALLIYNATNPTDIK